MSDASHTIDAKRDQSEEHRMTRAREDAEAMKIFAADRQTELEAGMRSNMSNPLNESHLSGGGKHGDSSNVFADEVRDEAAEVASVRPIAGYERDIVASQAVDSKYLNPTMEHNAFEASMEVQQQAAIQQDTGIAVAGAAAEAAAMSETPQDLDQHTQKSAQEGLLGAANPLTGREAAGGGMAAALSQARESGAIGALGKSGASMGGGNSLFGDGGKSIAAPSTPGQKEFTAAKQQDSMMPPR